MKRARYIFPAAALIVVFVYFQFFSAPFVAIPSKSMEPVFHVGDLILVKPADPNTIQKGDIIVISVRESVQEKYNLPTAIVHRVYAVNTNENGRTFITKGDNNPQEDPFTVFPQDVRGEVFFQIPIIGYTILYLHSTQGWIFLGAILLLILITMAQRLFRRYKPILKQGLMGTVTRQLHEEMQCLKIQMETIQTQLERQNEQMNIIIENLNCEPKDNLQQPDQA